VVVFGLGWVFFFMVVGFGVNRLVGLVCVVVGWLGWVCGLFVLGGVVVFWLVGVFVGVFFCLCFVPGGGGSLFFGWGLAPPP
ncbi:hypothetical protein, partial [Stenotrophomonas maltophilia]|uniref:hypothetical protein n=1 Tax=Stenotrophomonas maltophilia TaxID=40324 RepID=UPI00313E80A7